MPRRGDESEHEKVPAVIKAKQTTHFKLAMLKDLEKYSDKKQPKNTANSTAWVFKNYADWVEQRNSRILADIVLEVLLTTGSAEQLDRWLPFYVLETRNSKGDSYPPKTINQLLSGLLRHMRTVNPNTPNILDTSNHTFRKLHNVIDNLFKELSKEGVASKAKYTEIVIKEEESVRLAHTKVLTKCCVLQQWQEFLLIEEAKNIEISSFHSSQGRRTIMCTWIIRQRRGREEAAMC